MDSQKKIYKITFVFSVIVNVILIGLSVFIVKDSLSGFGEFALTTKNMLFVIAIVLIFTILNVFFLKSFIKISRADK